MAIFLILLILLLLPQEKILAQSQTTNLGQWQQTAPFVDSNHKSHPLPSFSVSNRYYVHTTTNDGFNERILYMAQQQTNGNLGPWQVAMNDHGGGPHGYTAVSFLGTAMHFRNGHIAQYMFNTDGTVSEIKLLEDQNANNAFDGNLYVWDTAVYLPFVTQYGYIYHLGGFNFNGYAYNVNNMYRFAIILSSQPPFQQGSQTFYKLPNISVPTTNPNKAAFFSLESHGYLYMGDRWSNKLYRTRISQDIGNGPEGWIDTANLPPGSANNFGDMFVINNTLFIIRGSKVYKAIISTTDGSLSSWDDSPPDLPSEQIDVSWDPTNTEGASYGIIGNYVYVTGPKKVYYAQIINNQQPTNSPVPTTTNTLPTPTPTQPLPTSPPCNSLTNDSSLTFAFQLDRVKNVINFNNSGGLTIVAINNTKQCTINLTNIPIVYNSSNFGGDYWTENPVSLPSGNYSFLLSGPRNLRQRFDGIALSANGALDCRTANSQGCGDLGNLATRAQKMLYTGDANRDNVINSIDYELYRIRVGQTGSGNNADFDYNNNVEFTNGNNDDFLHFKNNFGKRGV